ncbi:hypothetical protein L210DRAFT_926720 [Boletus edulis BED1]|uniref:Uncharacterized protein n=1 Tax=Boletus edulis BED1 TaxID=1328754 RepID=A0AAD4GIG6_BOLED|nr:hypothetical protein L210DRAFT_926720 [Boletus edulis BED1]
MSNNMSIWCSLRYRLKFLLSLAIRLRSSLTTGFVAALGRIVSLWRSLQRVRATFFADLPTRIQCSDSIRLPAANRHVVFQLSDTESIVPSRIFSPIAPTHSSVNAQVATGSVTTTEFFGSSGRPIPTWSVQPGVADGAIRYAGRKHDGIFANFRIPAGNESLSQPPPPGWQSFVHPEGNLFFYYAELRLFTDTYITVDNGLGEDIVLSASHLVHEATQKNLLDDRTELVLNVISSGPTRHACQYYFVDHISRRLFWLTDVKVGKVFRKTFKGVTQPSQIKYLLEGCYWSHCQYYPHNRRFRKETYDELRGIVSYAKADVATSNSSLSPFAREGLDSLLELVNSLPDGMESQNEYSICVVARLMTMFARNKFVNFHGQECARLDAGVYIFEEDYWEDRPIFKVVNIFLFGSLKEHANRLRRVWADHIIVQPHWKEFVMQITNESSRCTILSSVLLIANITFLAVPGVVDTPTFPSTPSQIIICASALTTLTSIVVSFVISKAYSNPGLMFAGTAANALQNISKKMGISFLAITHSLPMALPIWSITLFLIALAYQIFSPGHLVAVVVLGVACLILVLLGVLSFVTLTSFTRSG